MPSESQPRRKDRIRALVVDDSAFMRATITDLLERNDIDVVAEAVDGYEAVSAVEEHHPDVVTMDLSMPRMDGLKAVEVIMNRRPTPILVLSSHAGADADITFEALERGAVDFVQKPSGEVSANLATVEDRLVATIHSVADSDPTRTTPANRSKTSCIDDITVAEGQSPVLVIAASTGGPTVLEQVFSELPIAARFRILVVQHMPESFTERFAERLDGVSEYRVTEAREGSTVHAGEAVVAPGGRHLLVDRVSESTIRVALGDGDPVHNVKPAADVTLTSLADQAPAIAVGAVVTGMGNDGAAGLEALSEAGAHVIAQDEATSTVFGMPRRAIERGCVDRVVPDHDLATAMVDAVVATSSSGSVASREATAGGERP